MLKFKCYEDQWRHCWRTEFSKVEDKNEMKPSGVQQEKDKSRSHEYSHFE